MNDPVHPVLRGLFAFVGHLVFWSWNLLFLAVLFLGFGPTVLVEMCVAAWVGIVPWSIALPAALLLVLPLPFMAIGLLRLRRDPGRLLSLFYGVQAPLMLLCGLRIFAIGPLTLPTATAAVLVLVSSAGLLRTVLHGFDEASVPRQVVRQLAGGTHLVVGLWGGAVASLYLVLVPVMAVRILFPAYGPSVASPVDLVFLAFALSTLAVLAVFPFALVGLSLRSWQVVHVRTVARLGAPRAFALTAIAVLLPSAVLLATSFQPQHRALALAAAATGPEATDADRHALVARADSVRRGLVAARTGPDRLLDEDPYGEHIAQLWDDVLPFGLEIVPQHTWTLLMAPFTYHAVSPQRTWTRGFGGSVPGDVRDASELYGKAFDAPMHRAERETLLAAAHATWSWEEAQASLLDIGREKVHLDRQQLVVEPAGDVATVTVHDVYRSHVWDREEVLVAFSLPEGAAVTGLWLGASDDRDQAFPHRLSPRGAAQEVYEAQVQRSVDPALLEQVGPRQYRLRAFPVLPREGRADDVWTLTTEGPELHVWIEVVVPRQADRYPLPVATEVRNLFWDADTERSHPADDWLPASVPATGGPLASHSAVVAGWQVTATPADPRPVTPGRTAVLVDGSWSMGAHRSAIADALQALGPVDLWCVEEARLRPCPDYDPATALFFGSATVEGVLPQWQVEADRRVVLTDVGSYELAPRDTEPVPGDSPLWLVHLDGRFPQAYGDTVLDELSHTGGGVVTSIEELAWRSDPTWLDGWRWTFAPTDASDTDTPFTALATRALVAHLDRQAAEHDLAFFDTVHEVARTGDVVTAYSSMIVLVNEAQLEALADAEARGDRFDREVLDSDPALSSVPEPSTWLLLLLGSLGLGLGGRVSRRTTA